MEKSLLFSVTVHFIIFFFSTPYSQKNYRQSNRSVPMGSVLLVAFVKSLLVTFLTVLLSQ